MPLAMSRPWKHPKTGIYWLRKGVPEALREAAKTAPEPEEHEKVGGLRVSVDFHGEDSERIAETLKGEGAKAVRSK